MDALVRDFRVDPEVPKPLWRIASSKAASIGDRVFLFKQGSGRRGIFGVGELIEGPRKQDDPADVDAGPTDRARIKLTHLVNPAQSFLLDYDEIADIVPKSLIEAQQSGNGVPDEIANELDNRLRLAIEAAVPLDSSDVDDFAFDPDSITDQRERALRAIRVRRGQADFRAALMRAYSHRCAITGCAIKDVLEAAHIHPYSGKLTNHVSNGLLLRADIHTLFDCLLIAIEPESRTLVIADALKGSSYAKLAGRKLRASHEASSSASRRSLERRYAIFKANCENHG